MMHIISQLFCILVVVFMSSRASADDIDFQIDMTQSHFERFSQELGTSLSYKGFGPAEPIGIFGFDVGLEVSAADINEDSDFWQSATEDSDMPGLIPIPKIYIKKGLPSKMDIGLIYSKVYDSNISIIGAELKYAIAEGSMTSAAVALRGMYTSLLGVDQLNLDTYGFDFSISKWFLNMTPFGGVGAVWINSKPKSLPAGLNLDKEDITLVRFFAGTSFRLSVLNITADVEYTKISIFSLKVGILF
ncbi:MAG: hypothetical protein SWO11_17680 [Thermodesulfobacteriota bacterium]|nr:hypothetical protein [Thermodesulfobacteriota bacterium]